MQRFLFTLQLYFKKHCFSANDLIYFIIKYKIMEKLFMQSFLPFFFFFVGVQEEEDK